DRHAVPLPLAVVHRLVAVPLEREVRERLVGELRLLQAEHVDVGITEELLDARQSRLQRVDVPRRDSHVQEPWSSRYFGLATSSLPRTVARRCSSTSARSVSIEPSRIERASSASSSCVAPSCPSRATSRACSSASSCAPCSSSRCTIASALSAMR